MKSRRGATLLAGLLIVSLAPALAGSKVEGHTTNLATGEPETGVRLTLAPASPGEPAVTAVSTAGGQFTFTALAPGKYELSGRKRGYLPAAASIVISGGDDPTPVTLRLVPTCAISGKIADDAGDPVAGAQIELFSSRVVEGRRRVDRIAQQQTNDAGEYRFAGLAPGSYYVSAAGTPWFAKYNGLVGESAPAGITRTGYAVRYYPNVSDAAAAAPLVLKPGEEAGANLGLVSVPASTVTVHCESHEDLTKHYSLMAEGPAGKNVRVREGSASGELFHFYSVPEGHYTLRAEAAGGGREWYGAVELDVAGAEPQVQLTLAAAPAVSGVVSTEAGALPQSVSVVLSGDDAPNISIPVDSSGKFALPSIAPGRYQVRVSGADDWWLHDPQPLDLIPGAFARLNLHLSSAPARIAGTVMRDGSPVADALVVLAPVYRAVETASDGSFEFRGLTAGKYSVFAVEHDNQLEYAKPETVRPYLTNARKIDVTTGLVSGIQVNLASGKR